MNPARDPVTAALTRALIPRRATVRSLPGKDLGLAAILLVVQTLLAATLPESDGKPPSVVGWALLTASALVLIFRRRAPWLTTMAVICLVGPYHSLDYVHTAAVPAGLAALVSLAILGPPTRTFLTLGGALSVMVMVMWSGGQAHDVPEMLRSFGWLLAFVLIGEAVRIHRNYVSAIVERAERAERTREEEAARRVAEERLRIARDLHDLLAHSITLIGVQTSVAAHVLVADPDRLDRETLARALDGIADTCRDARAELRTTLEVLRADDPSGGQVNSGGPLPGLSGVPDLVRAAEGAGARVDLRQYPADPAATEPAVQVPAVVGAAAYRIVQESLTNAVRHAGPAVAVSVVVERMSADAALRVTVRDDGGPAARRATELPDRPPGFGIAGMRERARSIGGTLDAAPCPDGPGFRVRAVLPLTPVPGTAERSSEARTAPEPALVPGPSAPAPSPPAPSGPASSASASSSVREDPPKGTP
ncbi:sensor histidine kinase [Streptomyces gossypii]|uniref:sensor histidine kinase n=1 Tax=Streptomyces gossypii TaxID=2883101 RepID=UPI00405625F4